MRIDGRLIAEEILKDLKKKVSHLAKKNIIPHLAVVLVGTDPASLVYIKQKQKAGEEIGVKISKFKNQNAKFKKEDLNGLVSKLNHNPNVHGIIIQRPVPLDISKEELDSLVVPHKDVDGFHTNTRFTPPISSAVIEIIRRVFEQESSNYSRGTRDTRATRGTFKRWLLQKKILVIGRGETAGKPIANTLKNMGIKITVAHSQTNNLKKLCLTADIVVSCIGKPKIVRQDMVTNKSTIIGVGLHTENGKLQADYNQQQIASKVAFYTPVPGGVGPVNVACLFENLVIAVENLDVRSLM